MKLTKDIIWKTYVELGQFERHFSSQQSNVRTLASTWLIASFAGIGFVVSKTIQMDIPAHLLVSGICIVTVIGLILLWILDLLVYQRLLDAAYVEGLNLEKRNHWLPQVRVNMRKLLKGRGLIYSRLYYIVATTTLLVISAASLSYWLILEGDTIMVVIALAMYVTAIYFLSRIIARESSTTIEMERQIKESDRKPEK